jgi:hypothetical protein
MYTTEQVSAYSGIPTCTLLSISSSEGHQVTVKLLFLSTCFLPPESLNSQGVIFVIGKKMPFRMNCCVLSRANEFDTSGSYIHLSVIILFHS